MSGGLAATMALRLDKVTEMELRAVLEMAVRAPVPALSVNAERLQLKLATLRVAPPSTNGQLPLWEESGEPWRGRLGAQDLIRCDHFGAPGRPALLPLRTCLQRQAALWPAKKAPIYAFCASCPQGAAYKARTSYSAEEDWASRSKTKSRRYQFYRKDASVQQRQRRVYLQSNPDRILSDEAQEERPPELDPTDEDVQRLLGGG